MTLRIICCPDSFKESMNASEAARVMAQGVHAVFPQAECVQIPLSDGGEGFMEATATAFNAKRVTVPLVDALGASANGEIAVAGNRAVLEASQAVGIGMVPPEKRRIREMTTDGVGQMITAALDHGVSEIMVGLGGSGTNDGGVGMLRALGVRFLDRDGSELNGSPQSLVELASIDASGLDSRLAGVQIKVACDVDCPLLGPRGASMTFGPQKGASPEDVSVLERALTRLANTVDPSHQAADEPGTGAAGGLGFAFKSFLSAQLQSGINLVMDTVRLDQAVKTSCLVLTGEGALDRQTLMGKTLSGVAQIAQKNTVPLIGFAGVISDGAEELYSQGFSALVPIGTRVESLSDALDKGPQNLRDAVERTIRLLAIGHQIPLPDPAPWPPTTEVGQ